MRKGNRYLLPLLCLLTFLQGQTPETFAEHFGERFREQIRQNAELAAFLDEANGRQKR